MVAVWTLDLWNKHMNIKKTSVWSLAACVNCPWFFRNHASCTNTMNHCPITQSPWGAPYIGGRQGPEKQVIEGGATCGWNRKRDRGYRAFSCTFPRIDGFFPRNTINPFSTHTPPACYVKYSPADLASWGSSHIICEHCLTPNFLHTAPKWIQKDEFAVPVNPCWKINPTNKITRCALEFYIFSA